MEEYQRQILCPHVASICLLEITEALDKKHLYCATYEVDVYGA